MDTISRGNAAEAAVLAALIRADIPVYIPFGGGGADYTLAGWIDSLAPRRRR
jgi:hypothetical protein